MEVRQGPWSKVNRVFWWIATTAIVLMAVTTTADVLWRWITNEAIGPVYSLCETLMAIMVWAAVAPTQESGNHVSVTLLTSKMSERTKVYAQLFSLLLCIAFFIVIFTQTLIDGLWAYEVKSFRYGDYYRFPTYYARLFVPVGVAAMIGQLVFEFINNIRYLLKSAGKSRAEKLENAQKGVV